MSVLAGAGLAAATLAGCASGSAAPSPSPTTGTASPQATKSSSSPAVNPPPSVPATSASAVDYAQQYLTDTAAWRVAASRAATSGSLASAAHRAAGRAAVAAARKLLSQTWPASAQSDVHALALAFDTLNEDIVSDNPAKYANDGTTLNADANVVRAELGLPAIK